MELEELKIRLEKRSASLSAMKFSPVERAMLNSKPRSLMNKVLRSIKWEAAFSLLCGVGALSLMFRTASIPVATFLAAVCLYSLGFAYYLLRLHARVKTHLITVRSVKECLTETVGILERFTRLYRRLAAGFIPCIFLAAFLAGITDFLLSNGSLKIPYFALGVSIPIVAVWVFLSRKFTRWYLNRLFGNYLEEMKAQLLELVSDERSNL